MENSAPPYVYPLIVILIVKFAIILYLIREKLYVVSNRFVTAQVRPEECDSVQYSDG